MKGRSSGTSLRVGAIAGWAARAVGRLQLLKWQILQSAVAAGVSWQITTTLLHVPQTIFAPFAAMVALLGGMGGRGRRALMVALGPPGRRPARRWGQWGRPRHTSSVVAAPIDRCPTGAWVRIRCGGTNSH